MKTRFTIIVLLIALLVMPYSISTDTYADDHIPLPGKGECAWPQFRNNNFNNAYTPDECAPQCDNPILEWSYTLPGGVDEHIYSPPVVDYERVVVGSIVTNPGNGGNLYCFDIDNVAPVVPKWDTAAGAGPGLIGGVYGSPLIYDEKVYAGTSAGIVYCYKLLGTTTQGTLLWGKAFIGGIYFSLTELDGRLYFGTDDNVFYCIDAENGDIIWQNDNLSQGGIHSTPVVGYGRVWFSSDDGFIHCLDANDGSQIPGWPKNMGNKTSGFSPTLDFDYLYLPNDELYTFEAMSGKRLYPTYPKQVVNTNLAVEPIPTYDHELSISNIYLGTNYRNMFKLIESGKRKLWRNTNVFSEGINSSPSITSKRIYLNSQNYLHIFDADTGRRIEQTLVLGPGHPPNETLTSIAIAYEKLFFCSTSCTVFSYYCKPDDNYPCTPFNLIFAPIVPFPPGIKVEQGNTYQFTAWLIDCKGRILSEYSDKITFSVDDPRYADIDENGLLKAYDRNSLLPYPNDIFITAHIDVVIDTGPGGMVNVILNAPIPPQRVRIR